MPKAQIIAASEPDSSEVSLLTALEHAFPGALIIKVDPYIRSRDSTAMNTYLDRKVDVSLVLSGIRWSHLEQLANPALLPNPIVVTSNPLMEEIWSLKPAVIIQWTQEPLNEITHAMDLLLSGPVQFPEAGRTFLLDGKLWIRRPPIMNLFAHRAWDALKKRVLPGYKFKAWSFDHGELGWEFSMVRLAETTVLIRSPKAKHMQEVPKEDFLELASLWREYTAGNVPRAKIRDLTRYSTYIIGLLHWLEMESALT